MIFRHLICIPLALLPTVVLLSGCGNEQQRPADLPALYPCTVTVLQDGKPLSGGMVQFGSVDTNFKWSVFAQLDTEGKGKVFTQGLYPGAPEGEYKVMLSKTETVTEEVGPPVRQNVNEQMVMVTPTVDTIFSLVEKQYTKAETTPLSITIGKKKNDHQFDGGKPVREFLLKATP